MRLPSHRYRPRSVYPALGLAVLTAWLWAVLLIGRALPWQASRWWAIAFLFALLVSGFWWWGFFSKTSRLAPDPRSWLLASVGGAAAFLVVALPSLALVYGSDQFNHMVAREYWRMPLLTGMALLLAVTESLQLGATIWLRAREKGIRTVAREVLARRARQVAFGCLAAVAVLQATASVAPIGDDIWHYTKVADFLRNGLGYPQESLGNGSQYPVDVMGGPYESTGMARLYPALPVFPILLAVSFSVVGYNTAAISLVLAAGTVLFPLALYAACRGLTGSRVAAYAGTLLISLFPVYQIHVLGAPEPDGLFVALLLAVAALAARANGSPRRRDWLAMGAVMGLATLTRHEGVFYATALFATFLPFHRSRSAYWLSAATWAAVLAPFILLHYINTGSPWPNTFGGALAWRNIELNINALRWPTLTWYAQAVGVEKEALVGMFWAFWLGAVLAAVVLLRRSPSLVFIPLAGMGNVVMAMMVHPTVLQVTSPVEFQRHMSSGLAYVALAGVYATHAGYRWAEERLSGIARILLIATLALLIGAGLYYEAERLARPEPFFEGRASLLWTGSGYLLSDLLERPVPLPEPDDPRAYEQIREDMGLPLDEVDLRRVNRSEPYHWASLLLAIFGLAYAAASGPGSPRQNVTPPRSGS